MVAKYYPVRVIGNSMEPTIQDGDFLLVSRDRAHRIGDLVVVDINEKKLIKRVVDEDSNRVWLSGDNVKVSEDSREFGWVEVQNLKGKVLFRYWPSLKLKFKVN